MIYLVLHVLNALGVFGFLFQVDLVGGYYDAGDNVKFGLPMAFTTTLLAWSVIEFGSSMQSQSQNAIAAIRWRTDYVLKAATATPGTLYVQVRKAKCFLICLILATYQRNKCEYINKKIEVNT